MNDAAIRALVVGFGAGVVCALATTGIAIVVLARQPFWTRPPEERPSRLRVPLPLMGVLFVNGLILLWTLLGLVLGALFLTAESRLPANGLASENRAFTLAILAVCGTVLAVGAIVFGRLPWWLWVSAAIAAGVFGWGLPNLAK